MKEIWKFPLMRVGGQQDVEMPDGARIVHVAEQGDKPTLWALVDPTARKIFARFEVVGTGRPVEDGREYVGTAHDGPFIWHVFAVRP